MAGGDTKQRINELEAEIIRLKEAQPTLRDQFAMAALTSMLNAPQQVSDATYAKAAELSFAFADAMMEVRDAQG